LAYRAGLLFTVVHVVTLLIVLLRDAINMAIIASTPLFIKDSIETQRDKDSHPNLLLAMRLHFYAILVILKHLYQIHITKVWLQTFCLL
jgi:hypothetical protein